MSDPYQRDFGVFLDRDSSKGDFLLGFLSKKLKNVVDNLITNDDLAYSMVKQKLDNLDSAEQPQTAFVTQAQSSRHSVPKSANVTKKKQCNYCRKHSSSHANNHSWKKCERRRGKQSQKGNIAIHVANMSTMSLDNVSKSNFIFDTGASAYMCPSLDRFNTLSKCSGLLNKFRGAYAGHREGDSDLRI